MDTISIDESNKYRDRLIKLRDYANNQNFELNFSKNKSSFKLIEKVNLEAGFDAFEDQIAQLTYTSSSEIYYDNNIKMELQKTNNGQLLKNDKATQNWEITTDSRTIGTYLCYKAIQKSTFVNRKGETKTKEVIAWFAPSIPFNFGPKSFYGLPGLILELQEFKTVYYATKIDLAIKNNFITFPKGKTTTQEEYTKNLKAQMGM